VQGYYFSKPVPPEEFDRFIAERAEVKPKVIPVTRKTYMSLSRALTLKSARAGQRQVTEGKIRGGYFEKA